MLLVTGGAGFIGSNIVARLNEAGRTDIVVNDIAGHMTASGAICQAPARRFRAAGRTAALARRPQARRRHPYGRDLRHHRDRRRPGDGHQFPPVAAAARLVHGNRARRSSMRRRPRPMATASRAFDDDASPERCGAAADESLRLEQASVRPGAGRRAAARREAAAAMGRPEILQRVRPERVSQGQDGERAGRGASTTSKAGRTVRLFKSHSRRHRRRRPAPRLHLCRRRGARWCAGCWRRRACPACSMSAPARRAAFAR